MTWKLCRSEQIPQSQAKILFAYLHAIPIDASGEISLSQLLGLIDNFRRAVAENDAAFLEMRRGYRVEKLADVLEVAESREYFGLKGSLWPSTQEDLWKIFHEHPAPFEVLLTGAAGTAKSTKSWIATGYSLYLLSAMWNPQLELGMAPVDEIFFIFQSMRLGTATDTLFDRLKRAVDNSIYFKEQFPRDIKINSEMLFPHHVTVKPVTGATDAVLGLNVVGGCITEINFMPIHKHSVKLLYSDKEEFHVGQEMYRNLRNRIIGRYKRLIERGDFPGRLILDSARNHVNDFAGQKIEEAKKDRTILVIERALWDARAHEYPPDTPKFLVELATDHRPARIIESLEFAEDPDNVIEIPESFRVECEQDLEQALKDLAGVPSSRTGRFIPFPKQITEASEWWHQRSGDCGLFKTETVSLRDLFRDTLLGLPYDRAKHKLDWTLLVNPEYIQYAKLEGHQGYAMHVDTSLSGDAMGIAIGHIVGTTVLEKAMFFNEKESRVRNFENLVAPLYHIDGVLQVRAKTGEQIDLNIITDLGLYLASKLPIKYGSADWLESAQMLQTWRANRIITGVVSVDRTPNAYYELKHAIREKRIALPLHRVLDRELRLLRRLTIGGKIKVDHDANESKDCADAVAGVVGVLQRCEHRYKRAQ